MAEFAATGRNWLPARLAGSQWNLAIFCCAALLFLSVGIHLMTQLGITGDEPAYLLQGYVIIHFHMLNMANAVHDPKIYQQFYTSSPIDRVYDFRGNGVELIAYLPGYSLVVGLLYLIGGRLLVIVVQSLAGALTALLVFQQGQLIWRSRAVGLFAALAYGTSLPALLFAAQIFPSMLATLAAMVAFVLVTSVLPRIAGHRLILVATSISLLAALLPWLHVRYAPLAIVVTGAALLQLALPPPAARQPRGLRTPRRWNWLAAAILCGLPLLSFALVGLYSLHFFGTWYPQYRVEPSTSYVAPNLGHMLQIYQENFFNGGSGLIPWVPLLMLVPVGLAVLAHYHGRTALMVLLWILGLQSAFLSSAVAVHVNQAFALPARFTVECLPYFALCVAGVFALGWPRLRTLVKDANGGFAVHYSRELMSRLLTWQTALVLVCLFLLLVDAWFTLVAQFDLSALYPSREGIRLLLAYPHLLPGWWFKLFGLGNS
jgi:hypothetical protein